MTYQISGSNVDNPVELRDVTLDVWPFAGFFRFDDVSRKTKNKVFMVI